MSGPNGHFESTTKWPGYLHRRRGRDLSRCPNSNAALYLPRPIMVDLKTNFRTALAKPSFSLLSVTALA